jgi:thiamine-phosphate pyrophosphorylase
MVRRGDVWGLRRKPGWIIIAAAHSEPELRAAWLTGADAALLSPVFATASHPSARTLGVIRFARLAVSTAMPVYALGGVTLSSQKRLSKVPNLTGYATVSAV